MRQRRSNFKEREVQTTITEQVIKRVRVKFVSGAAGPERHEWFWPVNRSPYDSGDTCSLIIILTACFSKLLKNIAAKSLEYLQWDYTS